MKSNRLQKLCIILAFCMIILTVSPVFAQDTAPETAQTTENAPAPSGLGLLVLLGGLGAISAVGFVLWSRERADEGQA